MCDAIEGVGPNSTTKSPSANGVGLKKALPNFAAWYTTSYLPGREYISYLFPLLSFQSLIVYFICYLKGATAHTNL